MLLAARRNYLVKNALEIIVDALSGSGRFLPLVLQAHDLLVDGVDVLLEGGLQLAHLRLVAALVRLRRRLRNLLPAGSAPSRQKIN